MSPCFSSRNSISFFPRTSSRKYLFRNSLLNTAQVTTDPSCSSTGNKLTHQSSASSANISENPFHFLKPLLGTIGIIPSLECWWMIPQKGLQHPHFTITSSSMRLLLNSLSYSLQCSSNSNIITTNHLKVLHKKQEFITTTKQH
ncbi:hypothetical protein MTR_2g054560 [Medicago truncatula]|uniref:Uncharacterized protein n=1 Tax=Medicago truncatula TaxID=3880 RepID=A0A072V809_MEDTR|nr:hypothetical protein MTR_2g054560 [Medicago truncatula]